MELGGISNVASTIKAMPVPNKNCSFFKEVREKQICMLTHVHSLCLTHIHRCEGEPDREKRLYSGSRPGDGHICSSGNLFPDLSDVCDEGRCDHQQHPHCCIRSWRTRGVEHVNTAGQVSSTQQPMKVIYLCLLWRISSFLLLKSQYGRR